MGMSIARYLASLPEKEAEEWVLSLPDDMVEEMARGEWWFTARPEQIPPEGIWFIHLYLAGRGSGKSRAGSEWLVEQALHHPLDRHGFPTEWLVIAETTSDARRICLEGPSGVLRVLDRREIEYRMVRSPKPTITLTEHKTKIYFEGADSADVGRGYNAAGGWLDEIAKWREAKRSWVEGIAPSMRADLIGDHPRVFVTTTPKPIDLIREWVERDDGSVSIVRGSTFDNADNLSEIMLEEMRKRYEGTTIGKQELYGELLELLEGSLFKWSDIEANRIQQGPPSYQNIVVGVDPTLLSPGDQAVDSDAPDEMGVIVMGRDHRNELYVLADETKPLAGRAAAEHAWDVLGKYRADLIVYENNLGKKWMADVLTDVYNEMRDRGVFPPLTSPPMKPVHSLHGKVLRAEPVAVRYEQGGIHHIGNFEKLEKEQIYWDPLDASRHHSPNRLDALVHAARHLMGTEKRKGRIHTPHSFQPNSQNRNAGVFVLDNRARRSRWG